MRACNGLALRLYRHWTSQFRLLLKWKWNQRALIFAFHFTFPLLYTFYEEVAINKLHKYKYYIIIINVKHNNWSIKEGRETKNHFKWVQIAQIVSVWFDLFGRDDFLSTQLNLTVSHEYYTILETLITARMTQTTTKTARTKHTHTETILCVCWERQREQLRAAIDCRRE